jgi:hypothetical protein
VPIAFTTKVELSRTPKSNARRKSIRREKQAKKRADSAVNATGQTAAVAAAPVPVKANAGTYGILAMRRYPISRTGIVRRGVDWSSRRRDEHASRNRHGTLPSPMFVHGSMSSLGSGGARPIAPPETLYAPSHGGGSAPTSSYGGGYASSSSQGPLQLEPCRPKEGWAEAAWDPGDDVQRILDHDERKEWESRYNDRT